MKRIAYLILFSMAAIAAHAQLPSYMPPGQTISASGSSVTFANGAAGSGNLTFEYAFGGSPSGMSINVQGCMPGGTCTTLTALTGTNPYTSTTAGIASFAGGYSTYTVTATYTGTAQVYVSVVGIQAKLSGGGGGGAPTGPAGGDLAGTYPNPTVAQINGAAVPTSASVLGSNASNQLVAATSPQLVTALNTLPASTFSPTLLPSATNAAKGAVQLFPGTTGSTLGQGAINFHPNARTFCYGTSYTFGLGLFDQSRTFCANAGRDTPGVTLDAGVSSSLASADAINMMSGVQGSQSSLTTPNYFYADPVYPSLVLAETFENDSNTINTSFAQNMVMYMETWPTVPVTSAYSIAASAATAAGSPTTGTTFGIGQNLLANSAGSGRVFSSNTGSLTFNIPSSNTGTVMYFTYPCYISGGTFTFTNTTTSTSYVDNVSGTTTFNATCGGSSGITNLTPQTQRFTIAAGANTIVFAPSGANAANVQAYSVSWLPPAYNSTTGVLGLANQGVVEFSTLQAAGPFSGSAAVVNPIITSVSAQLLADGLPVFLSNQNTTETNGTLSARAWNSAVDTNTTATATCSAAQASNHPNECWQEIWWQHFLITQRNNGYYVSSSGLGGKGGGYTGLIDRPMSLPLLWTPTNWAHDLTSSFLGHAIDFQRFQTGQRFGVRYGTHPSNGSPGAGFPTTIAYGSTGQNNQLCAGAWSGASTTADADSQYVCAAGLLGNGIVWGGQWQSNGSAPTIASAGTTTGLTISGTNMAGTITLVTGGTPAIGALGTISFNGTLPAAPRFCGIEPADLASAGLGHFVTTISTTAWTFGVVTAPTLSSTYSWRYSCGG